MDYKQWCQLKGDRSAFRSVVVDLVEKGMTPDDGDDDDSKNNVMM